MRYARNVFSVLLQLIVVTVILFLTSTNTLSQDEDSDHDLRTTKKQQQTQENKFDIKYDASVLGDFYAQGSKVSELVDLSFRGRYKAAAHDFDLKLRYKRDPFSTKTFNFDDEDRYDATARVVQRTDNILAGIAWRTKWNKAIRTKLRLFGSYRAAELSTDNRWKFHLSPSFKYGYRRGWQAELDMYGEIRKYPNYYVNDRKLDQFRLGISTFGGYRWKRLKLGWGYRLSFIQYENARYDTQNNGTIEHATSNKSHMKHFLEAFGVIKPVRKLRIRLQYCFELNDSRNYDRNIQGRDPDMSERQQFISNYYDYSRHRFNLRARWKPTNDLSITIKEEFWVRSFSNYEARNAENVWLDELRTDIFWESNLKIAYRVWTIHGGDKKEPTSHLNLVGFVSHEHRSSNMLRETFFTANYTVTRIFAGVEVTGL